MNYKPFLFLLSLFTVAMASEEDFLSQVIRAGDAAVQQKQFNAAYMDYKSVAAFLSRSSSYHSQEAQAAGAENQQAQAVSESQARQGELHGMEVGANARIIEAFSPRYTVDEFVNRLDARSELWNRQKQEAQFQDMASNAKIAYGADAQTYATMATGLESYVVIARSRMKEIEQVADAILVSAKDDEIKKNFDGALKKYQVLMLEFRDTPDAEAARQQMLALKSVPNVAAHLEYAKALSLEASGKWAEALTAYKSIIENVRFKNSVPAFQAERRVKAIDSSDVLKGNIKAELDTAASKRAPQILLSARNYLKNGMADAAAVQLKKLIADLPGSTFAKEASELLETIQSRK